MLNIKKIEEQLNEEYKYIGTINIKKVREKTLNPSKIKYIKSIMGKVDPLEWDEPIIIANDYQLLDGYHRLKFHKENKSKEIKVLILEEYCLKRKKDNLFDFMDKLTGNTICFVDDHNFKINHKRIYHIKENEGCGGCNSGWSEFKLNDDILNKDIKINTVEAKNEIDDYYDLYINDIFIAKVDTGWGDGYYGGDFRILI